MLQDQTFVFVGTAESIANAKLLLDYNLAHLKVNSRLEIRLQLVTTISRDVNLRVSNRLHRVREMQLILTDDCGVCLSVGLSVTRLNSASLCKNG